MISFKTGSLLALSVVFAAYFYRRNNDEELKKLLESVLSGLLRAEQKVRPNPQSRVAVGFGACQDVISNGLQVLNIVGAKPPNLPEHFDGLGTLQDIEKVFAYFFRHGAAAERYVKNDTLFLELVAAANSLPETQTKLGGNAPVMATRFLLEGSQVLLGATTTDVLRAEISPDIKVVGNQLTQDDIHLLLEYDKNEEWGPYLTSRANRFIVHSDNNNPYLVSLEDFVAELEEFNPSLLVVGGLQMMDNFPFQAGERQERLSKVRKLLRSTEADTRIHFELASFAEEDCFQDVIDNVVYYADSLGMNEQELPNLHSMLTNGTLTLVSDPYPRIATTLDNMRMVFKTLREIPVDQGQRRINRLHVHTLAFQAIMTHKSAQWKNSMSAAAKAALVAHRHTCGSKLVHTDKSRILMDDSFLTSRESGGWRVPFQPDRPVSCWEEEGDIEICLAPVLVCTEVVQTGGGGDNVSSAGLVLQI